MPSASGWPGIAGSPRDAVLAEAGAILGRGKAFGLHEALDTAGALIGPLRMAGAVACSGVIDWVSVF